MKTLANLNQEKNKEFYKLIGIIAIPIIIQNLISASLSMVDTVMISSLGQEAIAAVGVSNQLYFMYHIFCFGAYSGAGIFIAQYFGKGDNKMVKTTLGLALTMGAVVGTIFIIVAIFLPEFFLSFFSKDPKVLELGVAYLKTVGLSYLFQAGSFALAMACRGVRQTKIAMYASLIAFSTNTVLNYILIFGKLGFAPMGVTGAAVATVISRFLELAIMVFLIYKNPNHPLAGKWKELMSYDMTFVKKYFNTALPVIISETLWGFATVFNNAILASTGTTAIAAVQVAATVNNIFMVWTFGIGAASSTLIGNALGAGDFALAKEYAKKFKTLAIIAGTIVGLGLYFSIPIVNLLFNSTAEVAILVGSLVAIRALALPIIQINNVMQIGTLRGGGDTKFVMFVELASVWLIALPIVLIAKSYFGAGVVTLVALQTSEYLFKFLCFYPRTKTDKWVKNIAV